LTRGGLDLDPLDLDLAAAVARGVK
jgi:hypothetical protein